MVLLSLITTLLLGGCSDYSLFLIPASGGASTSGGSTVVPQVPNSPWGSLDPGDFPEAHFAVVWNDPREGCLDCPNPFFLYERPRYDIIDSQGRVAVRFELPWQDVKVTHLSLHPAGPGRFLAESSLYDPDDPLYRKLWFGDGLSGEVEVVMEVGSGPEVYLPQADRMVTLPESVHAVHVRPDPQDPDRVYLLARVYDPTEDVLLARLYSIDVRDPDASVFEWYPQDMVPTALLPEAGDYALLPWLFETFRDGEGSTILLGVADMYSGNYESTLVIFSPEDGPRDWTLDVTGRFILDVSPAMPLGRHMTARPPLGMEPGQAILHQDLSSMGNCYGPGFTTWDGAELVGLDSSDGLSCMKVGTQIEPSTSTFLYFGQEEVPDVPNQERLVLSHQGQDVWDYTSFRDGLVDRPFDIHEIASLERPSE